MKVIENTETWELIMSVLEEISNDIVDVENDTDHTIQMCDSLAEYTYKKDIETGLLSQLKLRKKEREGDIFCTSLLVGLERHFFLLDELSDKDYSEYRDLLYNLHAYLGNQYYYKVDREIVKRLLLYGKSLPQEYHNDHTNDKQTKRTIASVKFLRTYGIQINVEYGSLSYSKEIEQQLFQLLEQKVRTVGGNLLLHRIYEDFLAKYIAIFDHYIISRQIGDERNEPVNLLLNLSVKHLSLPGSSLSVDSRKRVLDEIIHLAESWLDIMDMQPDSGIEYALMDIDTYPIFLNNGLIFDKMCIPKQYSRKFILIMLEHLIKPWFDKAEKKYSFEDYYAVADYIMNIKNIGKALDIPQMFHSLKVSNYKIKLILKDISMPSKDVNSMFTSLDSESNFYKRPLIEFPINQYMYIDYHFCGNGFYLAAYDMIKDKFPNLDKEQGPYVEKMLRTEIERKGYQFRYGEYFDQNGSSQSDCDVVMNGNRIYFFEVKKRAISDEFDKIDDVAALRQLSYGMVKAQKQCFYHERYLMNNGEMILKHGDGGFDSIKYEASLLPAYKISVCLPEYSFLTNKLFCMNLLEAIMLGGFSTVDSSKQGQLAELNELGRKIAQCEYDIHNRKQYKTREASFYSLFCSMQQLLTALWCSNSEEEFLEIIRDWIYTTDKSLNLYYSLAYNISHRGYPDEYNVRKAAIDMLEAKRKTIMYIG